MPCSVTADRIEVQEDGSVRVSGTFSGTQEFSVRVVGFTVAKVATRTAPTWFAEFSGTDITGDLTQLCSQQLADYQIVRPPGLTGGEFGPCIGTATATLQCGDCPEVTISIDVPPRDRRCVNGRTRVDFRAEVTSADDATYQWFFGTDEDNQPGEDSEAGDWLPAPDADGVRRFGTFHVYEPTSNEPQLITVTLVTSSGPNAECPVSQSFTLEPCPCDLTVTLALRPPQTGPCLTPGDYTVVATRPTGDDIHYVWSLDGEEDEEAQDSPSYSFSIAAGETKDISVSVDQGACEASRGITVVGCEDCTDYSAQLRVLNSNGNDVTDADCLAPGTYTVEATSPTGADNFFSWDVNNEDVPTPTRPASLSVSLGNNDKKIVTVAASRGGCSDTATVVLETCTDPDEDCKDYSAQLRVLDSDGRDVTGEDCLPSGSYTVEATSPDGLGNTLSWEVNNEDVTTPVPPSSLSVDLGNNDQKIVTVGATRGKCSDTATAVLQTCRETREVSIGCMALKGLALLGLGLIFLGTIILLCPALMAVAPPTPQIIAATLIAVGTILLVVFLILWCLICDPDECDWFSFLWEAFILLGLLLIYAALCPACFWMLGLGILALFIGAALSLAWSRQCRPSLCRVLAEWTTLMTFGALVVGIVEIALALCVLGSRPIAAAIWGLALAIFTAVLWSELKRNNCIRD